MINLHGLLNRARSPWHAQVLAATLLPALLLSCAHRAVIDPDAACLQDAVLTDFGESRLSILLPPGLQDTDMQGAGSRWWKTHAPVPMGCKGERGSALLILIDDTTESSSVRYWAKILVRALRFHSAHYHRISGSESKQEIELSASFRNMVTRRDWRIYVRVIGVDDMIAGIAFYTQEPKEWSALRKAFIRSGRSLSLESVVDPDEDKLGGSAERAGSGDSALPAALVAPSLSPSEQAKVVAVCEESCSWLYSCVLHERSPSETTSDSKTAGLIADCRPKCEAEAGTGPQQLHEMRDLTSCLQNSCAEPAGCFEKV